MAYRIAVVGSGPNGASIAADLIQAGHYVVLVDQWPDHVAAIRRHGIRVEMPAETPVVPAQAFNLCDVCIFRDRFDIILVLMKAYDARWTGQLIEPYLAPDGILACVQNGMTADIAAEVVGLERSAGCMIEVFSQMSEAGVVERHTPADRSWLAVSDLDAAEGREEQVASLLRHSGAVSVVADIRATKCMKLVSDRSTLVTTAILGLPMLAGLGHPGMRELMIGAGQGALELGQALATSGCQSSS